MSRFNGTSYETEYKRKREGEGHIILNLSPSEPGDLLDLCCHKIIEIKSCAEKEFKISKASRQKAQLQFLLDLAGKTQWEIEYAIKFLRLKGEPSGWQVFSVENSFSFLSRGGVMR